MPGCFHYPTPQPQNKTKKSVRFCERVEVFLVIPRSEYTEREVQKCFLSHEYHQAMKLWLFAVGQGMRIDETRGLEYFLPEAEEEENNLRELHVNSVLNEQERQDQQRIEDDIAIAEACRRTSAKGAIMAYIAAKKDERAAFGAYMKIHSDYTLRCVAPSPTSMDKATVRGYFAASDINKLSVNLLMTTPAA